MSCGWQSGWLMQELSAVYSNGGGKGGQGRGEGGALVMYPHTATPSLFLFLALAAFSFPECRGVGAAWQVWRGRQAGGELGLITKSQYG